MDSVQTVWRPLVVEDFGGANAVLAPTTVGPLTVLVLGVGSVPLTPFVAAADDTAAAAAGIVVGQIYINTGSGTIYLAARLS